MYVKYLSCYFLKYKLFIFQHVLLCCYWLCVFKGMDVLEHVKKKRFDADIKKEKNI